MTSSPASLKERLLEAADEIADSHCDAGTSFDGEELPAALDRVEKLLREAAEACAPAPEQLIAALKMSHETLNKRVIGEELTAGHHDTHADGWQAWMKRRRETLSVIEAALRETP